MSLSVINEEIRKMLPVLIKNGIIEQCEPGDSILPEQEYRLYPSRYICTAHWSVTERCNYRCKHCYMSAPDAKFGELSHSHVMYISAEGRCLPCMALSEMDIQHKFPLITETELCDCL
ncbi:MAG: radical SAM protein, partial [Clostridia bacterium]|nr:radical SAM protein [Clostridia bacterium]